MSKDRLFIITGASKGIGKGLAERALAEGYQVIGISRSHSINHPSYTAIELDLSDRNELTAKLDTLFSNVEQFKEVILINNAGTLGDIGHLGASDNLSFYQLMDLNVSSPLVLMNEFVKRLSDSDQKRIIINISSGAGKKAVDGWSAYCASKAAIDLASQVAAKEAEMDNSGIIIKSIAPGVVDTNMQDRIREQSENDFSSVQRFIDLKEDDELSSLEKVAEQYFHIIDKIEDFEDVLLDVRQV